MYEQMSYEIILDRMLERVPEQMDKREGSVIYDALAPAAMEVMMMYLELENILQETFGDTASREYLIKRARERGIIPREATYAVLKGVFDVDVEIESRFNVGELNYIVTEKITDGEYKLQCETAGIIGNSTFGDLIPIEYIENLTSAELTEVLIPGEDAEDTEVFRKRYLESFDVKQYGGNVADYIKKTNSIDGVGATKVTPVWNGGGTVKLTILDSEFNKANETLVNSVQEIIDPAKDGTGVGIAPIGHMVTVDTVNEIEVNISTSITFEEGYSFNGQKEAIEETISAYLLDIRKEWAEHETLIVRIAQIESKIMALQGIIDITGTKINGEENNLVLTKFEVPVTGVISNE